MGTKLLVVAIDFGTTFSGYAFSFRQEFERESLAISTNSWVCGGQGVVSLKTPTTILLSPDEEFHSFGYEAEDKYSSLAEDKEHEDWYYFRRFKMMLHNNPQLNRTTPLVDVKGKELPARIIFTMAIQYLKGHLIDALNNRIGQVDESEIQWVLTVPAIWTEAAKQFMRECAETAGISHENLLLALESEAASLYCKTLPINRIDSGTGACFKPFDAGTTYMVVDLGGGTVDVTVHEVGEDGSLREVRKADGGPWGGTLVDSAFLHFLGKLFGNDVLGDLKKESMSDYLEMTRLFEIKKRTIKTTSNDKVKVGMPLTLFQLFENRIGQKLLDVLPHTNYCRNVTVKHSMLHIDAEVFKDFFKESIDDIVQHLRELLSERRINTIILVGGYAESEILVSTIRDRLPDTKIVVPSDPGLAVLKGAVLFGHRPKSVLSRVSRYTYGVEVNELFICGEHPDAYMHQENGTTYCGNIFDKFVLVGQHVASEAVLDKYYTPNKDDAVKGVGVYASTSPEPIFITDPSCFRLGTILLREPVGGWTSKSRVQVRFQFGGTEFSVIITDYDSGSTYSDTYDFLRT